MEIYRFHWQLIFIFNLLFYSNLLCISLLFSYEQEWNTISYMTKKPVWFNGLSVLVVMCWLERMYIYVLYMGCIWLNKIKIFSYTSMWNVQRNNKNLAHCFHALFYMHISNIYKRSLVQQHLFTFDSTYLHIDGHSFIHLLFWFFRIIWTNNFFYSVIIKTH